MRYKAPRGGRGSSKSWSVAAALELFTVQANLRVLCTREFQKSIKQSVHKLLKDQIDRLGLRDKFSITDNSIKANNGSEFIFEGLHSNIEQIKSLEGVDICWVEEGETVAEESWRNLIPTIRKDSRELALAYKKMGVKGIGDTVPSEIWCTFNPRESDDPTSVRFISKPPANCWSPLVNYSDNPFFPSVLRLEMEHDYKVDPETAMHVWGGEFRKNAEAQIFKNFRLEEFEPQADWSGPRYGLDHGFSHDPISCHEYWAKDNTLYVYKEAWGIEIPLNNKPGGLADTLRTSIPNLAKRPYIIMADCSRPETINHLQGQGLNVKAAPKWPGSVEDGIGYLKALDAIVIHPTNCPHAATDARLYSYAVKKGMGPEGKDLVTRKVKDAYNHFWDDCRYALSDAIKAAEREYVVVHEEPIVQQGGISPDLESIDSMLPHFATF